MHRTAPTDVIHRLAALADPEQRSIALVDAWATGDEHAWAGEVHALLTRAHRDDDDDARVALGVVVAAAGSPRLAYDVRQRLYEAALAAGQPAIARLFFNYQISVAADPALAKKLAAERPLRPQGKPLTLGERKSLARSHRRDLLIALCKDPHPDVVRILLGNPHLTEADAVRIASLRPAVAASLAVIAADRRWLMRPAVRRALVWNPSTPLDIAVRMTTLLRAADLAELASNETVAVALRTHAREILAFTRLF